MRGKLVIAFIVSLPLTACAVSDNPREGGFFGGLHGLYSGAYDARIQKGQEDLSQQQSYNQGLREQSVSLYTKARAHDSLLASEQDRLSTLEGNNAKLESDVSSLTAKSEQQKVQIADLRGRIEDQMTRIKSLQSAIRKLDQAGGSNVDPGRYQMLQRERDHLNDEYSRLLKLSQALSKATN